MRASRHTLFHRLNCWAADGANAALYAAQSASGTAVSVGEDVVERAAGFVDFFHRGLALFLGG